MIVAPASVWLLPDALGDVEAVEVRHVRVEQDQGEGMSPLVRLPAAPRAPRGRLPPPSASSATWSSDSTRMRRLVALSSTTSTGSCSEERIRVLGLWQLADAERGREVERAAAARPRSRPRDGRPSIAPGLGEIVSPRPVPPNRRVVEPSAWWNGFEDRRLLLRGDADAGVGDREVEADAVSPLRSSTETATATWPRSVNLIALPTRLIDDLPQPVRIADERCRHVGRRRRQISSRPFCCGPHARAASACRRQASRERERRSPRAPACPPRSSRSRGCR